MSTNAANDKLAVPAPGKGDKQTSPDKVERALEIRKGSSKAREGKPLAFPSRRFRKGTPRTHHVHAVDLGGPQWRRHVAVRDFLREHPDEARAYAEEKRRAAAASGGDRDRYVEGKDEYVAVLEQRALAWAEARPADR